MNTHPQIKSCHHELKEGILTLPSYSNKRHPFLFASHCFPVQAFTCKACSSSHNPFSFIKLLISRCLFNNGMPSNVSLTMVSSSLAPQPSEWSRMVHSICEGYCFFTWFCGMYKILWSWSDWLDDASHMMSRVLMSNGDGLARDSFTISSVQLISPLLQLDRRGLLRSLLVKIPRSVE